MEGVILLDDAYGIKAMDIDYALVKFRKVKGERRNEPIAYFSSVTKCLQEYVKQRVHGELDVKADISLTEAIKRIEQATARCYQLIEGAIPKGEYYYDKDGER